MITLTAEQKKAYDEDGFVVLSCVFKEDECRRIVDHMMDLHAGRKVLEGFEARHPDDWQRTFNPHSYDPLAMDVLLFHGALIHRGGPIGKPGSLRHVMANHYIPYHFEGWPYKDWPRYSFDGEKRYRWIPVPDYGPSS